MSRLDRMFKVLRSSERRVHETRLEDDPVRQRREEALGRVIRESWNEGPRAPSPEMLIAQLRPRLAEVDRELNARPSWRHVFGSARDSFQAVPGFALAAACALAMLYFVPASSVPNLADGTAAASVTELQVENPVYPIYDLAGEQPLMILEGEDGSTVIWILDQPEQPEELSRYFRLEGLG